MVEAYILMKVKVGSERKVIENLNKLKELNDVNELYGDWDIIVKVKVEKIEELDALLTEKIRNITDIEVTSTMVVANYIR